MRYRDAFEKWLRAALKRAGVETKREIIVTARPRRNWDVSVDFSEDGKVKVDFYSVIRRDERLRNAINYAVKCIRADRVVPSDKPTKGESVRVYCQDCGKPFTFRGFSRHKCRVVPRIADETPKQKHGQLGRPIGAVISALGDLVREGVISVNEEGFMPPPQDKAWVTLREKYYEYLEGAVPVIANEATKRKDDELDRVFAAAVQAVKELFEDGILSVDSDGFTMTPQGDAWLTLRKKYREGGT